MVLKCDEKLKEKTLKYIDEKIDEMFIAKKRDTFERDFDFARISYIIHRIKREVNDI